MQVLRRLGGGAPPKHPRKLRLCTSACHVSCELGLLPYLPKYFFIYIVLQSSKRASIPASPAACISSAVTLSTPGAFFSFNRRTTAAATFLLYKHVVSSLTAGINSLSSTVWSVTMCGLYSSLKRSRTCFSPPVDELNVITL